MIDRSSMRVMGVVGAIGPPLFVVALIVTTVLTPGYSHFRQTVSELAAPGAPHPEMLQAAFVMYGALVLAPGFAMYHYLCRKRGVNLLLAGFLIYSVSGMLAALFRDASVEAITRETSRGDLHDYVAMATYGAILGVMLLTGWLVRNEPRWRWFAWFSLAMTLLTGAFGLLFELHNNPAVHGLYQRGFFAATLLWVEALSLRLAFLPVPVTAFSAERPGFSVCGYK